MTQELHDRAARIVATTALAWNVPMRTRYEFAPRRRVPPARRRFALPRVRGFSFAI